LYRYVFLVEYNRKNLCHFFSHLSGQL